MSDLKKAIEGARAAMNTSARDWAANQGDAYLYGIVVGWDVESIAELRQKFGWDDRVVHRLQTYAAAVENAVCP
jgi:ABC-type microcin C transport system permease subunit YejB